MVRNRAKFEGSMCEEYIIDEISTFGSFYFEPHIQIKLNRVPWNDDGGNVDLKGHLSVFIYPGHPLGEISEHKLLNQNEYDVAHWYVLLNHQEINTFVE